MAVIGADLRPAAELKFRFPARNRTYGSFCGHGLVLARTFGPNNTFESAIRFGKMPLQTEVWNLESNVLHVSLLNSFFILGHSLIGACRDLNGIRGIRKKEITTKCAKDMRGYGAYSQPPGHWSDDGALNGTR